MEIWDFVRRHHILMQQIRIECRVQREVWWPELGWMWHVVRYRNG